VAGSTAVTLVTFGFCSSITISRLSSNESRAEKARLKGLVAERDPDIEGDEGDQNKK